MVNFGYQERTDAKMAFFKKKGLFESNRVLSLPVSAIVPNPNQPRTCFEEAGLLELAASIRENGILQPLSVRRSPNGFELVSGERRLRAARLCSLREVPCIVLDVNEQGSSLLALVENLQRRDLDFWEEATALSALIRTFDLTHEEAARKIGKSQPAVANKLRLLALSPDCVAAIRKAGLSERHARALLRLEEEARPEALQFIIENHLNVAQTDDYVDALLSPPEPESTKNARRKPTYIIKDVRLFLNTVTRGLSMMKTAGVAASCQREEDDHAILLTITIPK